MKFDFKNFPIVNLEKKYLINNIKSVFSIILYNNDADLNSNTVNSVLDQTYSNFELVMISNSESKIVDKRIVKIKNNFKNVLSAYNYGISKLSKESEYVVFIKNGDILDKTYLEDIYWSMITHDKATWGFSNYVVYDENCQENNKLVNQWYNQSELNVCPVITIKKNVFENIGLFEEKEDYALGFSLFLKKMVNNGLLPIHISWYLTWIKKENYALLYENDSKIKKIKLGEMNFKKGNKPFQFPFFKYNYEDIDKKYDLIIPQKSDNGKINILMIVPWIITGGADIFNLEFIKRLDKEKFSVTLLSTEPYINNLRQKFDNLCDVYDLPSFLEAKDYLPFIKYLMEKNNINMIFNTSSLYGYSILPYLKAYNPEIPIVDYIHMEEWYNRNGGYSRSSTMVESIIDQTWVCNSVTEKIMHDYFGRKKDEVKTIYIGVDTEKFNPEKYNKEKLRLKFNIPNDKKIIGYICRISEQKRPLLLADIIDKTIARRNDVLFLIVGDGSMLDVLKRRVSKYKDNVKFLPSTDNTPEMYALCDITINCSIKEGLALTAYESLSMGIPVISADVGGQRELVGGDVGYLVKCYQDEKDILDFKYTDNEIKEYVDAIDLVIDKYDKIKPNCRKKILNKFTLDQMGVNMTNEFLKVFNNPKKEKIENGKALSKNIGITKELIIASLMEDKDKTVYQCNDFFEKNYKSSCKKNEKDEFYKKENIKNKLWKSKTWRKFTKSKMWKVAKKIARRG